LENNLPKDKAFTFLPGEETEGQTQITYSKLLNGERLNALASTPTNVQRISFTYSPVGGTGAGYLPFGDIKTNFPMEHLSGPVGMSVLFFFYLLKKLTKQTPFDTRNIDLDNEATRTVLINREEFLRMRGKEINEFNKKNASKEIKAYLNILASITMNFEVGKETINYHLISAEIEPGRYNKHYAILFNYDLVRVLIGKNFIMNIPDPIFTIDEKRHPNAFSLTYFLSYYYGMNYHKANKGKISLKALLPHASNIPSLEEMKERGEAHRFRTIIEPLEKDLDYLRDEKKIIKDYYWANPKDEPLTDAQLDKYNYETLSECILIYEMRDFPEVKRKELEAPKDTRKKKKAPKKV
jgi:hypothetical protein